MDLKYLENKPEAFKRHVWMIMEEMQEEFPYFHWGWDGFVLMVHFA